MKTVKELAKFLKENASFDGSGDSNCPHCGKVLTYGNYSFDHTGSYASNIASFLGFGQWIREKIEEILGNYCWSNDTKPDYTEIANDIIESIEGKR